MKSYSFFYFMLLPLALFSKAPQQSDNQDGMVEIDAYVLEQNQNCFKCHGQSAYTYYNPEIDREIKQRMNPYFIFDSAMYYTSNHRTFQCIDCHSFEYSTFPHAANLRMEPKFGCLDCHAGDSQYEQFHFEKIDQEYQKSVHSSVLSDDFSCNMCHNPHSYKISARTNEQMSAFILYDNEICLGCHADITKYQLLTTNKCPNLLEAHAWLPNQVLHFKSIRCIECHTEINNDILVAHNILPKDQAIKSCVECHSKDSRLIASLYKYQFTDDRSDFGFSNQEMLKESYVIGANRNYYLNVISFGLFGLVLLALLTHAVLRIIFNFKKHE